MDAIKIILAFAALVVILAIGKMMLFVLLGLGAVALALKLFGRKRIG